MFPQIIHERERRRLTRKNGQRPLSLLPQGSACQPEPSLQKRHAHLFVHGSMYHFFQRISRELSLRGNALTF